MGTVGMCLLLVLAGVGCGTTESVTHYPDANRAIRVVIPEPGPAGPVEKVDNLKNPKAVIKLARNLSAAGRHQEAAGIYLDAAGRFDSVGKQFENDCKKAAVREYCIDGDFDQAKSLLSQLQRQQGVYAKAYESEDFTNLRDMIYKFEQLKENAQQK